MSRRILDVRTSLRTRSRAYRSDQRRRSAILHVFQLSEQGLWTAHEGLRDGDLHGPGQPGYGPSDEANSHLPRQWPPLASVRTFRSGN